MQIGYEPENIPWKSPKTQLATRLGVKGCHTIWRGSASRRLYVIGRFLRPCGRRTGVGPAGSDFVLRPRRAERCLWHPTSSEPLHYEVNSGATPPGCGPTSPTALTSIGLPQSSPSSTCTRTFPSDFGNIKFGFRTSSQLHIPTPCQFRNCCVHHVVFLELPLPGSRKAWSSWQIRNVTHLQDNIILRMPVALHTAARASQGNPCF